MTGQGEGQRELPEKKRGKRVLLARKRQARKRFRIILLSLVLLGVLGWVGNLVYWKIQREHSAKQARLLYERKDFRNAVLLARRAITLDPTTVDPHRVIAQTLAAAGSRDSLSWWRRVVELEPLTENRLAMARAALQCNEPAIAEQSLAGLDTAADGSAPYHYAKSLVAQRQGRMEDAEASLQKAIALDSASQEYQLSLAAVHLASADAGLRDKARQEIQRLASNPELHRLATQLQIQDALRNKDTTHALALAGELAKAPSAPLEDGLYHLSLLRQLAQPAFAESLSRLEEQAAGNSYGAASVIAWLNTNGMSLTAIEWSKRLPPEVTSTLPVPSAVAECYEALGDWNAIKALVTGVDWGALEFMRYAYLARALLGEGDKRGWNDRWNSAMKAAGDRPEMVALLARNASRWGWENESLDLLWSTAQAKPNQQWALRTLQVRYAEKGDARGLLRVASRVLELNPTDVIAKNNVASLSLLLNTNVERAQVLAKEAHEAEPKHPGIIATLAFAMHCRGKNDEGIELMRPLGEERLKQPAYAVYYGVLLAASGRPVEAAPYLKIATSQNLLPEETALLQEAGANPQHRRPSDSAQGASLRR